MRIFKDYWEWFISNPLGFLLFHCLAVMMVSCTITESYKMFKGAFH